ncbi:MAG: hypothetical protein PF694_08715 [Bacteroidetes bacterium]|jgi:hypothetical protein|nr:hypothetical protein [Bacteroidota bacterium]
MKKIIGFLLALGFVVQLSAQAVKVMPVFSMSGYEKYHTNFGYGIGYDLLLKSQDKLSFTFTHSFNMGDYSTLFLSDADGRAYHRDIKPKNQRISIAAIYSFKLLSRSRYALFIGPKLGINYFGINESIVERRLDENEPYAYRLEYWEFNKIGLGFSLAYERKLIADKLSLTLSTEPDMIFFSKFGLMGSSVPPLIGFLSFQLKFVLYLGSKQPS